VIYVRGDPRYLTCSSTVCFLYFFIPAHSLFLSAQQTFIALGQQLPLAAVKKMWQEECCSSILW